MTRDELANKIAVLLGGRAAEKLIFGHTSTGAADDLAKATDIARAMVARYGMDAELGAAAFDRDRAPLLGGAEEMMPGPRRYSEATAQRIDEGVAVILEEAFASALGCLEANRKDLVGCAADLLERETLSAEDLEPVKARLRKGSKAVKAVEGGKGR
jgi:cell division protease FtsH